MKTLIALLIAVMLASASATIINIPEDYATIQAGIDASNNGDTVLVSPGTYVENINFNGHSIVLGSLFFTTGDTSYISLTVIDGSESGSAVTFENSEDSSAIIIGFTIANSSGYLGGGIHCEGASPSITMNIFNENSSWDGGGAYFNGSTARIIGNLFNTNYASVYNGGFGGAIYCENSSLYIAGNNFVNNLAYDGGGAITCISSSPTRIEFNVFYQNLTFGTNFPGGGGAVFIQTSDLSMTNNLFNDNRSTLGYGGAISCWGSNPVIVNSILWADTAYRYAEFFSDTSSSPQITYCDISGGHQGEGNIDVNPLFRDPDNGDYHLMAIACGDPYDSPCIDMGAPTIIDTLLDCDWGLGTERSDMGAYGGGEVFVGIDEPIKNLPAKVSISQNYPNPFNISTMIKYELPQQSQVMIDIYDVLGRKVATLEDAIQPAGYHKLTWNAEGLSSGVYFYKIQAGDFIDTKKMMLIK